MVRIPSEYQEVEWIESTGTQFIDLDFGFDPTDEIETRFSIDMSHTIDKYIVSPISWNDSGNRFAMGVFYVFTCGYGSASTTITKLVPSTSNDGKLHYWIYKDKKFTIIDLDLFSNVSKYDFGSTTANLRLFYGYAYNTKGKIASYHHKKADGTEINFIPCYHKSSGEIGMYDTVSKQFYTNSGTGTFLKGNDVTYNNINLLESRRRILLNTPHIETISDTIAGFKTDVATKLKGCKIYFTPIQEGEGDPSPDNVRPIHGWDGVNVYHNNNSITIPFPQTIYGGYVDLVKGEVVEEIEKFQLDGTENMRALSNPYRFDIAKQHLHGEEKLISNSWISDMFSQSTGSSKRTFGYYGFFGTTNLSVFCNDNLYDLEAFKQWLSENTPSFCAPLATPNTYQIDPQTLKTLKGMNNIWSDANGNIEVSFYTH